MGLRDIEAKLPPGFRFYPSDEELVCYYLYKKITNDQRLVSRGTSMVEVDLHACEPWQLPDVAKLGENEWYFFSFRERKYATGFRTNRATTSGYWKATGKDKPIYDSTTHEIVGMRKTLVFYRDRAPNGIKTDWVMHEFRMENQVMLPKDWVLCRVFHKNKGELITTTKFGLETETATTTDITNIGSDSSSPKFTSSSSIHHQTMPETTVLGYHHHQPTTFSQNPHYQYNNNTSNSLQDFGIMNPDSHDHDQFITQEPTNSRTGPTGDEFGFIYDMVLDENYTLEM